jgi:hypothetical protein
MINFVDGTAFHVVSKEDAMRAIVAALSFCLTGLIAPSLVEGAPAPLATDNALAAAHESPDAIRAVLAHDGAWVEVDRWGSVWLPDDAYFKPYSLGHWTVDGTVWAYHGANVADDVTAHYGHWIDDPLYGWIWKPDGNWRPAAVAFRMGRSHIGWAPLDPDGNTPKNPADWVFVKGTDAVAEKLDRVTLPPTTSADWVDKTEPLAAPPTEMAVLGLPEPSLLVGGRRVAATERTAM